MQGLVDFAITHPFWGWTALAALLLAGEVATSTGYLLWPAASAAVLAVMQLAVRPGLTVSLVIFAVLTIVSTVVARRFLPQNLRQPGPDINDRARGLIGRSGHAVGVFTEGRGRVFVDGVEWIAETDEAAAPAAGATVQVVDVLGGGRLKVKAA